MKPNNYLDVKSKLLHLLLDFTDVSNASVYRVQVIHPSGHSADVAVVMTRCVVKLSQFYLCADSGDCATSYLIVSHLAPAQFENMLQKMFDIQIRPFRAHGVYTLVF